MGHKTAVKAMTALALLGKNRGKETVARVDAGERAQEWAAYQRVNVMPRQLTLRLQAKVLERGFAQIVIPCSVSDTM